jgi:hypothetical protein
MGGDFDCCKRPVQVPASNSDARKHQAEDAVMARCATAWDEGYAAGNSDAFWNGRYTADANPYRAGA